MSLKKLGIAMLAVFVLGAIMANSAFAENSYTEPGSAWYTGASPGTKLAAGSTVAVTTSKASESLTLTTTAAGSPLKLAATAVNCTSCVLKNVSPNAIAEGTLEFTGVTVVEPANCSVEGGKVTTKALKATVGMGGAGTAATVKYAPAEGTTFATVKITGASCPIASTYKVTGVVYSEAANATGVFAKTQKIKLSEAIQKSAGTSTSLKFGENAAYLTGEVNNTASVEFAAKEK